MDASELASLVGHLSFSEFLCYNTELNCHYEVSKAVTDRGYVWFAVPCAFVCAHRREAVLMLKRSSNMP
jgi:hypothetical protein